MSEMNREDEFYVGYQPAAPPALARRMHLVAAGAVALAASVASALVLAQSPFDNSRFEFDSFRRYRGQFFSWPYPLISSAGQDYLLAGRGKHGAGPFPGIPDGAEVELQAALASHGSNSLLEWKPGTLRLTGTPLAARTVARFGTVALSGEIADTKCYFGVMNPGKGKVHRACAARCISGGLPPGLVAKDAAGNIRVLLLVSRGGPWPREFLSLVGEPVTVIGELVRAGSTWILETAVDQIRRE